MQTQEYLCDICNMQAKSKSGLTLHKKTHTREPCEYKCVGFENSKTRCCRKSFKSQGAFTKHNEKYHSRSVESLILNHRNIKFQAITKEIIERNNQHEQDLKLERERARQELMAQIQQIQTKFITTIEEIKQEVKTEIKQIIEQKQKPVLSLFNTTFYKCNFCNLEFNNYFNVRAHIFEACGNQCGQRQPLDLPLLTSSKYNDIINRNRKVFAKLSHLQFILESKTVYPLQLLMDDLENDQYLINYITLHGQDYKNEKFDQIFDRDQDQEDSEQEDQQQQTTDLLTRYNSKISLCEFNEYYNNNHTQIAFQRLTQMSNPSNALAMIREDINSSKTNQIKCWNRVILIEKLDKLFQLGENKNTCYHQIIFRAQSVKFFFDLDFKEYVDFDARGFVNVLQHTITALFQEWSIDVQSFRFRAHYNDKLTGCHLFVNGLQTNIQIVKLFTQQLKIRAQKLDLRSFCNQEGDCSGIIDPKPCKVGGTLRLFGIKSDFSNSYVLPRDKTVQDYLICNPLDSDQFVHVPFILRHKLEEIINPIVNKTVQIGLEDLNQKIEEYCLSKNIRVLKAYSKGSYKLIDQNQHMCLVCCRKHSKIHPLNVIVNVDNIKINCFQNTTDAPNGIKKKLIIWQCKTEERQLLLLNHELGLQSGELNIQTGEIHLASGKNTDLKNEMIEQALKLHLHDFVQTQQYVESDNRKDNDFKISEQQIKEIKQNRQSISICSQLGTGKTEQIYKLIENHNGAIVSISVRKSHSQSQQIFGLKLYSDTKSKIIVNRNTKLVIQLESLKRLVIDENFFTSILILDEIVSLFSHFHTSSLVNSDVANMFIKMIQSAGQLIIADAHVEPLIVDTIQEIRDGRINHESDIHDKIMQFYNPHKPLLGKCKASIQLGISDMDLCLRETVTKILRNKQNGIKTAIYSTSCSSVIEQLFELLSHKMDKKHICMITGRNDQQGYINGKILHSYEKLDIFSNLENMNEKWVCLYTQSLSFGVSFQNHPDFKSLIAIVNQNTSNGAQDVAQSLRRFRSVEDMHVILTGKCKGIIKDSITDAEEYFNQFNGFISSTIHNPFQKMLEMACLVSISKQKASPNIRLIRYLLDLGIEITSVKTQKLKKIIKSCYKEHEFGVTEIKAIDVLSYKNKELYPDLDNHDDVEDDTASNFRNNQFTLRIVGRHKLFDLNTCIDISSETPIPDHVQILKLNNHIEQNRKKYTDLIALESKHWIKITHAIKYVKNSFECHDTNLSGILSKVVKCINQNPSLSYEINDFGKILDNAKTIQTMGLVADLIGLLENTCDSNQDRKLLFDNIEKLCVEIDQLNPNGRQQTKMLGVIYKFTPFRGYIKTDKGLELVNNFASQIDNKQIMFLLNKDIFNCMGVDSSQMTNIDLQTAQTMNIIDCVEQQKSKEERTMTQILKKKLRNQLRYQAKKNKIQ